jgi:hypothetical protein
VDDEFGWLFKRNQKEHDFGIDGHVEIVTTDGFVTGQALAMQIKYGNSFFREKTQWGYVYKGEEKHFNYLFNYPIPVIIVICHPDDDNCYWEVFNPAKTQRTKNGWKITIPFENKLSSTKEEISNILPPIEDGSSKLESYWISNELMFVADYIAYFVDKSEVESLDVTHLREFFDRIIVTKELCYHCKNKVEIAFSGYDDDPRELFEIEEIRKYIALADPIIPELFFFIRTDEPTSTLRMFVASLVNVALPFGKNLTSERMIKIEFDPKELKGFLEIHFIGLNKITEWLGMSIEENKMITYKVMRIITPDLPKELTGGV